MKFNKTFAAILTITLTAGINFPAIAASADVETIKENRVETTDTRKKSRKNSKSTQGSSQGNKCAGPWCGW